MEIIDMSEEEPNEFRLLEMGEVFQTDGGTYMKCSVGNVGINAVNLKNGAPSQFVLGAVVKPVKAKLILNEQEHREEHNFEEIDDMDF